MTLHGTRHQTLRCTRRWALPRCLLNTLKTLAILALGLQARTAGAQAVPKEREAMHETPATVAVHKGVARPGLDLPAAEAEAKQLEKRLQEEGLRVALHEVLPFGAGALQCWTLGNGLTVLLLPDPAAPVVAVHTWVRVGSAHEKTGKSGLAHLLEHLMFKATKTRPAGTFDRVLEQWGSSANAATFLDWTYYHETVPPDRLAQALELEADRLQNLALTQAAFKAELEVVRNERREHVDNDADGLIDEALYRAAYGDLPYGHPTLGWMADLDKTTLQDVVAFYRQHYAPDRVAVVLAGGLQPEAALRAAVQYHGAVGGQGTAVDPPPAELPKKAVESTLQIEAGAERLAVAWRAVPGRHADHPALSVLVEALANADSTRLEKLLIFENQVASGVSGHVSELRLAGLVELRVSLLPGKTAREALGLVDGALKALLGEQPLTEAELQAAKNRLRMEHYRELAAVDGRAEAVGHVWATFGDLRAWQAWWQSIEAVTLADAQRAARTWLRPDRRVVILGEVARDRTVQGARKRRGGGGT